MVSPNKDLGPCVVVWDGRRIDTETTPIGGVLFTKTFGGVFFRYEELQAPIKRDQAGETHVDDVTIGATNPELEVPMTQEDISKLDECFANSLVALASLRVSNPVGEAVYQYTRQVIVKPIINGVVPDDPNTWLYIHRAFPRVTMEQAYDNSAQRTVKVLFKGYPDDNSPWVNHLWQYGPLQVIPE